MKKLSKLDLRLLAELEKDSRQTLSQIAKKLKNSQQVVSYRIQSLQKRKIVGGFYTIINFASLGYTSYRTMIRFTHIAEKKQKEIISYLGKHSNVLWLVECEGRWDLIINFLAKNIIQYNSFIQDLKKKFPRQIQNYDVLVTIEGVYFGRDYFEERFRRTNQGPSFGGLLDISKLTILDLKILNLISEDARMNAVEISNKLDVSPNTIILRIKNLIKSKVIQGFKPLIHLENTPYLGYKALIKFQNLTSERENQLIDFLKSDKNVVGIIKLIGEWDFEFEFEVESSSEMLRLTRKFRDKFKEVIMHFEVIPLFHEYKYNFFPKDLLAE